MMERENVPSATVTVFRPAILQMNYNINKIMTFLHPDCVLWWVTEREDVPNRTAHQEAMRRKATRQ
jgi:hypothetical protein